VNNAVSGHCSR